MNPQNKAIAEGMIRPMVNLYGRWQDEKAYEDFADYRKVAETEAAKLGAELIAMTSSPFRAKFQSPSGVVEVTITSRAAKWLELTDTAKGPSCPACNNRKAVFYLVQKVNAQGDRYAVCPRCARLYPASS